MSDEASARSPLADAQSPFLRHGAVQPVAWLPFGAEAFRRARALDRPILLDIGAVWCHWCHVMDRESYEDEDTAALINELYVPVKVDRDAMPDVDARYQRAVQSLTGQGGWPLTAFLTPDGEVFHGGTYFPPEDAHGRPSFGRVLREVARVWRAERGRATAAAAAVRERLATVLTGEAVPGTPEPGLIDRAVEALSQSFDARHGGFGRAPKFPNAGAVGLLLERWLDDRAEPARRMAAATLDAMVAGGIHDQLGGGFHRYSTDARWIVPHFEKMAYDNGVLMEVLARAGRALDAPDLIAAAEGVASYYRDVAGDLVAEGGFPASQDADIGFDDDGDYWTWTEAEIRAALSDEDAAAALLHFGLTDAGGAMHLDPDRHVLFRAMTVAETAGHLDRTPGETRERIDRAKRTLKAVRDTRPAPYLDRTLYTGWVALVASGHLALARHGDASGAGTAALAALDRVWDEAWSEGRGVAHRVGSGGVEQLGDQAYLAAAAVDAFEWSQDRRWIERARAVTGTVLDRFRHPTGGLADRPRDAGAPVALLGEGRLEITDSPEPSPTAVTALTLARLGALDHDPALSATAREILAAYAGSAPHFATAAATYFRALRWVVGPVTTIVVVEGTGGGRGDDEGAGDAAPPGTGPLLRAALRPYRPATVVRRLDPARAAGTALPEPLAAMVTGEAPRAYVCVGRACAPPVSSPAELVELIRTFGH